MEALVRFDGAVAVALEKLVDLGYYRTKSEAIRAGILELAKEYRLVSYQDIEADLVIRKVQKLNKEATEGKIKMHSLEEVLKESNSRK